MWTAIVYVLVLWPYIYDVPIISAHPLKAIHTKTKTLGNVIQCLLNVKENAESSSYGSSLQHEGAHDTSSQTKKTAPSLCHLKRKFFFFLCVRREHNKLRCETMRFLSTLKWEDPAKAHECNFLWINPECVKLHHGTRVLLLYLTSFTENVKKTCWETPRLRVLNWTNNRGKVSTHWLDKIISMVRSFLLMSWSGKSYSGWAG